METHKKAVELIHMYLDGDIDPRNEEELRSHLEKCEGCRNHFHELERTITLIQSTETVQPPSDFTNNVMRNLPREKKSIQYKRWFKNHPFITAAAVFFIFIISGVFTEWNQDNELVVSKQDNLVIQGDKVIVPKDVVVDDDLIVRNGDLLIKGTVEGDVTIINGKLLEQEDISSGLMASVGEVNGELQVVDRLFDWIWYQAKNLFQRIFSLS